MRRFFVLVGLLLTVAAAQDLQFWSWRVEDQAFYDRVISMFEAENPGVNITFTPYRNTEYATILSSALAAGQGPDIIHTRAYGGLAQFADNGFLLAIDESNVPAIADFPEQLVNAARSRVTGGIYGVPFATQTIAILYNEAILEDLGIALPQTWDEFLAALETIQAAGIIPIGNGGREGLILEQAWGAIGPMFYGGTEFFNEVVEGTADFTDPRFVRSLEALQSLTPYFPPSFAGVGYDDGRFLFINELAAFYLGGSFEIGYFRSENPELRLGMMAAPPLEVGGSQYVSFFADGNYSVNATTPHQEAALSFLNFLATQEFGQMFTTELAQISAVPDVVPTDPLLARVAALNADFATPYMMLVGFRWQNPTGSVLMHDNLQQLLAGTITAEQAGANVTEGVATWHTPFQR